MKVLLSCLISNVIFAILGYISGKSIIILKVNNNETVEKIIPSEPSNKISNIEEEAFVPDERIERSFF